jgi:hypothetical protein
MLKFLSYFDRSAGFLQALVIAAVFLLASGVCRPASGFAAALTDNRDTPEMRPENVTYLTQGSNVIYAGSIVVVYSNGTAQAAADTNDVNVVGRAETESDNTGANYLSTRTITVKRGVFRWANGDSISDANVGDIVYVSDDQTVQKGASTYNIIAGTVSKVDSSGVWVDTHDLGAQGASTPASLAVSGAATVGATLGVTGATTLRSTANIAGTLTVTGNVTAVANQTVGGTLGVTGVATLSSNLVVSVNQTVGGTLDVTGATIIGGALTVTGAVTHVDTPVYTEVSTASNVVAAALENLPVGATTNAAFLKVTVGATSYAVPMYALP